MSKKTVSPRHVKRKKEREKLKIDKEFQDLVSIFVQSLFGYDFDSNPDLEVFPVFEQHLQIWAAYCRRWNQDVTHISAPNPFAFYDFAMNQDDKGGFVLQVERTVAEQRMKEFEEQFNN